ncbi:hypothetical protein ACIHFC_29020 [Streptomyces sp. NPDC052013]|uniref:hypothetical protein n=1 Tax=Streptomyces sp. NPDC052013 TaxID=3365679 RepID=UPI0037CE3A57
MSAYSRAYKALTSGRPMRPGEAAQVLAQLRKETGDELASVVQRELSDQYRRTDTDTDSSFRRKRREFGAAMRIVARVRELAAAPFHTSLPHQRNRSTS